MITIENGHRTQTAATGNILIFDGMFAYMIYLGDGAQEWDEVLDSGQLEPLTPEIIP